MPPPVSALNGLRKRINLIPSFPRLNLSTMTASESPSPTVYGNGSEGVDVNVMVGVSVTVDVAVGVCVDVGVKVTVAVGVSVANMFANGAFDPLVSQTIRRITPKTTRPIAP